MCCNAQPGQLPGAGRARTVIVMLKSSTTKFMSGRCHYVESYLMGQHRVSALSDISLTAEQG